MTGVAALPGLVAGGWLLLHLWAAWLALSDDTVADRLRVPLLLWNLTLAACGMAFCLYVAVRLHVAVPFLTGVASVFAVFAAVRAFARSGTHDR